MPILEDLKEYTERATGLKRPGKQEAPNLTRRKRGPLQGRRSSIGERSISMSATTPRP